MEALNHESMNTSLLIVIPSIPSMFGQMKEEATAEG
jgi:hypothetical protein